jgi:hypothetical protein
MTDRERMSADVLSHDGGKKRVERSSTQKRNPRAREALGVTIAGWDLWMKFIEARGLATREERDMFCLESGVWGCLTGLARVRRRDRREVVK